MKKLKPLFLVTISVIFAMAFRGGVRRFAPRLYNAVWGQNVVVVDRTATASTSQQPRAQETTAKPVEAREVEKAAQPTNPVFPEGLEIRGVVGKPGRVNVYLSDGSVLTENDVELGGVTRNSVVISGKKYPIKPAPRTQPSNTIVQPAAPPPQESDRRLALTSGSVLGVPSEDEARSREAKASSTEEPPAVAARKSVMSDFDSLPARRRTLSSGALIPLK